MFPSTDTVRRGPSAGTRRTPTAPARPAASPSLLRRVAGTLRAFALLEDPELDARVAREAAMVRAHHRRAATTARRTTRARRPGAPRCAPQHCRTPLPK